MSGNTAAKRRIEKMVRPFTPTQKNESQVDINSRNLTEKTLECEEQRKENAKEQTEITVESELPEDNNKENDNSFLNLSEPGTSKSHNTFKEIDTYEELNKNMQDDSNTSSVPPTPENSQIFFDFSSGSSDNYVPNTDSDESDESCVSVQKKKKTKNARNPVTIEESDSESLNVETDRLNVPEKRKRKSVKERREDRLRRLVKRNAGEEYVTLSGKLVKSRKWTPLVPCRKNCSERIPLLVQQHIFNEYWNVGSYDERAKYLERLITIQKKKSMKLNVTKTRNYANQYSLIYFEYVYPICRNCLLKTLGESNRCLQTVNEKIQANGHVSKSQKGRAASYRKISEDRIKLIEAHIHKFPAYESHYSRSRTSKKYLSADLTVEKMYSLYKAEIENPVSVTIYRKVFRDMNLSFKKPAIDTCNKCNLLQAKLNYATSEEERDSVQSEIQIHQEEYEAAYDEKRKDKERARSDSEQTCVIAFDLQQCLPTPLLTTSSAFYKRQLWVYNLTIHDFKTNHAYCYMWPESSGGRGANQIASCLYNFISIRLPMLHPNAKHLILYSDSCGGQNKNSIVTTMLLLIIQNETQLKTIEHKFLVPGHTHMEVDSDHALIERAKKRTSINIHHPRDWFQLVRTASNRTNKFSVIEMTLNDFYDFSRYSKELFINKKLNCIGQKFIWSNVRVIRYTKEHYPAFEYKNSFKTEGSFISMTYAKKTRDYSSCNIASVKKCYTGLVPISAQKKRDLISLLPYIDPSVHDFYKNLETDNSRDIDPDLNDLTDD